MGTKIVAVNAGPRMGWNTETLIAEASKGAESVGAAGGQDDAVVRDGKGTWAEKRVSGKREFGLLDDSRLHDAQDVDCERIGGEEEVCAGNGAEAVDCTAQLVNVDCFQRCVQLGNGQVCQTAVVVVKAIRADKETIGDEDVLAECFVAGGVRHESNPRRPFLRVSEWAFFTEDKLARIPVETGLGPEDGV